MPKKKKKPIISMIASIAENRAIGRDNELLWHIPEDLKYFKKITRGHPIIMGRKTFESIGQALPHRTNIILTRNLLYKAKDCLLVYSLEEAIEKASEIDQEEIFIIGGETIFVQGLPLADKLYLTVVKGKFEADSFFPKYSGFKVVSQTPSKSRGYSYTFLELERS